MATQTYERKRERAKARSAAAVLAGQDIGAIPPPLDAARRKRARDSFQFFCEAYFPALFNLGWSDDHLRVLEKIERTVVLSETFAVAMPRGAGKTTLCTIAVVWAILEGYHAFAMLVGSTEDHAVGMLDNIKSILSSNEALLADYPEALYPIRCLGGETRRAGGQRYYGVRTQIGWEEAQLVMPTIPGSKCSGAVIGVAGITGNIRGRNYVRADGSSIRPTLAVVDDPQTDPSARSPAQVRQRLAVLNGTIAGLAGPGKKMARIVPCTVICQNDLADQLLDRERNPEWQGERTKLVYSFPRNEALWDKYAKLRLDGLARGEGGTEATEFYRRNREAMDEGAEVAWRERFNPDELSAVQNAMNLRMRDLVAFCAEYQNEPMPSVEGAHTALDPDDVKRKVNGLRRGEVPNDAHKLTAFIDVQGSLLWYCVCAWADDFTGYVIDYGSYPDQGRPYYTLADSRVTLQTKHPGKSLEATIYAGLGAACDLILGTDWKRDDGTTAKVDRLLIDANWGESTAIVKSFCRHTQYAGVVVPSHGKYLGASSLPFTDYRRKKGERMGHHWWVPVPTGPVRHVMIDVNFWKTFATTRLAADPGEPGCVTLHRGRDHQMFADQVTAEYGIETVGRGRTVVEWKRKPGQVDNHLLDCYVGCCVGASMQGVTLSGLTSTPRPAGDQPAKKRKRGAVTYL
jgi:hypothetical protein